MNESLLKDLTDQYLTGTITKEGKAELAKMMDNPEYREKLEAIMQQSFKDETFMDEEDPELRFAIQLWLSQKIKEEKSRSARIFGINRWVAAASVIVLITAGALFFTMTDSNGTQDQLVHTIQPGDIPPGKEGAILTLSDGRQIVLDSSKGAVAIEGSSQIINENGQLAYKVQGDDEAVVYNTMTTPKGRQYQLVLADGSKVWLNAASSITFPSSFKGSERKVTITGEAYFEVAPGVTASGAKQSFQVEANGVVTEVLGTHFNVNAYENEDAIKVTLLEGSVIVKNQQGGIKIQPGQQAIVTGNQKPETGNGIDLDAVMAWKNGFFQFNNASLDDIMKQVARWYDVDVEFTTQNKERLNGTIPRNVSMLNLFKILELTGKVHFKIDGKKVKVLP